MSDFLAKTIKDQTDSILRRMRNSPGSGAIVRGGTTTPGTGPGTPPEISEPSRDLTAHKASSDHDGRYYTETELNNGQLDTRYYTEAEVNGLLAALTYPNVVRDEFNGVDTIVVEHSLGAYPIVQVIGQVPTAYGAGNYGAGAYGGIDNSLHAVLAPSNINHDSINQVTVTLSAAAIGEVVCVG